MSVDPSVCAFDLTSCDALGYRCVQLLGMGASCAVFRARTSLGANVAVKLMAVEDCTYSELKYLQNEV